MNKNARLAMMRHFLEAQRIGEEAELHAQSNVHNADLDHQDMEFRVNDRTEASNATV
ncbi:hypothetical protein HOH87_03915 [bacterium]|jgi:hypothetical protein|nr:hypothetical protein [bacterium]